MLSLTFYPAVATRLLLLCQLLIFSLSFYAQGDTAPGIDISDYDANKYDNRTLLRYIQQVDSIAHTAGIAGHFSRIYITSMNNINVRLEGMDSTTQTFIKKFEFSFVCYFLEACHEFENRRLLSESVWNSYFSNSGAQSWQLTLMGVNAHVNGDIWKGLVINFTDQEIRRNKKNFLSFQTSVTKAYHPFFDVLMSQSTYLRFINGFTKGLAKRYGEWLLYKWRQRQIKLAILYFQDNEKFKKKLAIVNRKRNRIDRVILRKVKPITKTQLQASGYDQIK